jgi:hypothetical protein
MRGPPDVPRGTTRSEFGTRIMRWGTGDAAARARMATLTRDELTMAGVTLAMAVEWREFYHRELVRNPSNPSAAGRAHLMQRAADLLSGGE